MTYEVTDLTQAMRDAAYRVLTGQRPTVWMILDSIYPSVGGGGAESQVRTISAFLKQCGYEVRIIAPMVRGGPTNGDDRLDDVRVTRIPYPKVRLIGSLIMLTRLAVMLWRGRREYHAIHAHIAGNMSAVATLLGRLTAKPVVVKVTGYLELNRGILSSQAWRPWRSGLRAAIRSASWIQATSRRIQSELEARGFDSNQVRAIPNAVDTRRYKASKVAGERLRKDLGISPSAFVAVYSGRLEPEKGVETLIEAWATSFGSDPESFLLMMGTGQLRESLEARWRERALVDNVVFLGSRNDIAEVLSMADVFVLPSLSEGLSNSLLEAMACGLPVVGTRVSGTEDLVVNNETGLLVEPGDAIGLAGALNSMKAAEHGTRMSMGETSRARIVAYASIESVVMRLTALYGLPFHLSPADMRARGGH